MDHSKIVVRRRGGDLSGWSARYDGDNVVDFAHVQTSDDGVPEYACVKVRVGDRWIETGASSAHGDHPLTATLATYTEIRDRACPWLPPVESVALALSELVAAVNEHRKVAA